MKSPHTQILIAMLALNCVAPYSYGADPPGIPVSPAIGPKPQIGPKLPPNTNAGTNSTPSGNTQAPQTVKTDVPTRPAIGPKPQIGPKLPPNTHAAPAAQNTGGPTAPSAYGQAPLRQVPVYFDEAPRLPAGTASRNANPATGGDGVQARPGTTPAPQSTSTTPATSSEYGQAPLRREPVYFDDAPKRSPGAAPRSPNQAAGANQGSAANAPPTRPSSTAPAPGTRHR